MHIIEKPDVLTYYIAHNNAAVIRYGSVGTENVLITGLEVLEDYIDYDQYKARLLELGIMLIEEPT